MKFFTQLNQILIYMVSLRSILLKLFFSEERIENLEKISIKFEKLTEAQETQQINVKRPNKNIVFYKL